MENLSCYGYFRSSEDTCRSCQYSKYCKDSTEINAITSGYDELTGNEAKTRADEPEAERRYTRNHLMQLTRFMLQITEPKIQRLVMEKLEFPDVTLAYLGSKYGVTRQAIGKSLKKIAEKYPELDAILHNKPMYNLWRVQR